MNIKNPIGFLILMLSAWMTMGSAQAQVTNYDFSTTTNVATTGGSQLFSATLSGSGSGASVSFTGISNATYGSDTISLVSIVGSFNSITGKMNTGTIITFTDSTQAPLYSPFTITYDRYNSTQLKVVTYDNQGNGGSSNASFALAAAPEMDGSFAPKVGLLLGGLFLMFARKKKVQTEVSSVFGQPKGSLQATGLPLPC